jgi:hypothetical protein
MQKCVFLLFALSFIVHAAYASDFDTLFFRQQEQKLILLQKGIKNAQGSEKNQLEIAFRDSLAVLLQYKGAQLFQFDSIKSIGHIISSDEKLHVYTWNIPQSGGYNNYYGIIQFYLKKDDKYISTVLEEKTGFLNKSQQAMAQPNNWPGALYYKIITNKVKDEVYYTLLGFDFNNLISNRKVIEVINIDEFGIPVFKQQGFVYNGKKLNRIVFEYTERAQMQLDYNDKTKLIVFDHLSPSKPSLQDQYQFYGPDLSYDGLKFIDGIWVHQSDITPEF